MSLYSSSLLGVAVKPMAKYQFFTQPNTNRRNYTFLNSDSESFIKEKEQLMQQGFIVEDGYIYADNVKEAAEKFKSNYFYALDEYNASYPESGFVIFVRELFRAVLRLIR